MFKSSLATHSSIDHDLFPLLTVRSCVSEADESKNGPRFCAEDKMTGGAYEIRSRKLALVADEDGDGDSSAGGEPHKRCAGRNLSPENLGIVKRQQDRINALLSASAHCSVPACVSLPIDVYIQEQPSTGDTYVASVDAFSGLSLGDIIRSGWGIMEECVFLEILNAVEAFGYASAGLPPHGNLSSDAIKQLLIVRDGASEARQPSRWVVSDWLLLSDATVTSFDPQAFVADLEWVLHSSFAQLHISTVAAQGSTVMGASRVEELVSETVERIRAHLLRHADTIGESASRAPGTPAALPTGASPQASQEDGTADADAGSLPSDNDVEGHPPPPPHQAGTRHADPTMSLEGGGINAGGHESTDSANAAAQGSTRARSSSPAPSATSSQARGGDGDAGAGSSDNGASAVPRAPSPNASASELFASKSRRPAGAAASPRGDSGAADAQTVPPATQMSLKDKVAYHQAALRNEQLLVNKHRRKNAPLPPRPQPLSPQTKKARLTLSPSAFDDDEQYSYDPPLRTSPIEVKPSAYLMQGRRPVTGASGRARKAQSPRSGRTLTTEARTPRENSRSTTTPPHSQTHVPTTPRQYATSRDQQRERLLDDVVSMALMTQRRRIQDHRQQAEVERQRREEWQQALLLSSSSAGAASRRAVGGVARAIPALLEKPRTATTAAAMTHSTTTATAAAAAAAAAPAQGKTAKTIEGGARRGSGVPGGSGNPATNSAAPLHSTSDRFRALSESPEPQPPSPPSYRVVRPTVGGKVPAARPAQARAPVLRPRGGAGGASGRGPAPTATAATPLRSARGRAVAAKPTTTTAGNGAAAKGAAPPSSRPPTQQQQTPPLESSGKVPPVVKPLPLSSVLGNLAAQRAAGSSSTVTGNGAAAEVRTPKDGAAAPPPGKTPGASPRFSNRSPRVAVPGAPQNCGGGGSPRWPNTARPPPGPQYPGLSPRTFRRVSSTGMMGPPRYFAQTTASRGRMPANQNPVRAAAPTAAPPQPLALKKSQQQQQQEQRSARARRAVGESALGEAAAPLRTTTPRPRMAADVEAEKALSPAQRKAMRRLAPRKVRPKPSADNTPRGEGGAVATAVGSPGAVEPAELPAPRPAAMTAVRRGARTPGPLQTSRTGAENRAPRERGAGGYSAAGGASSAAKGSPKGVLRQKHGNVRGAALGLRTEPLTLGSVRPVNETSPGILLRRQHSSTV